jgi:type II secretory pathway pseudopilin PulG
MFAVIFYTCHKTRARLTVRGYSLVEAVCAIALIGVGVASTLGALTKFNSIAAISRNGTGAEAVLMNQTDLFQSMGPFNPQATKNQIPRDMDPTHTPYRTYDMSVGTRILGYKDPTTGVVDESPPNPHDTWPVYREPPRWTYANAAARTAASGFVATDIGQLALQNDIPPLLPTYWRLQTTAPPTWAQDTSGGIIVKGTMTCTVTDISTAAMPNTYQAVFTIGYQYLGRGPVWNPTSVPPRWEYQLSMTVVRTSDI